MTDFHQRQAISTLTAPAARGFTPHYLVQPTSLYELPGHGNIYENLQQYYSTKMPKVNHTKKTPWRKLQGVQSVKKLVFDRLTEVKEAPKTSNLHASAYVDTVAGKLRSKAKTLAVQAFSAL